MLVMQSYYYIHINNYFFATSFIAHDPEALASNKPAFMPTTHKPTFIDSLLPSDLPSTSPSSMATVAPSDFEVSNEIFCARVKIIARGLARYFSRPRDPLVISE